MDPIVTQLVLQDRKIAYALTDRDLNIVEISGMPSILGGDDGSWLGRPLLELVPELIGSEDLLADILEGAVPHARLPWINRTLPDDQTAYLTMVELPQKDATGRVVGLIHLVQDLTEMGRLDQRLAQERNQLRLLQEQLDRQNLALIAANSELRQVDEMKSNFVSVTAHELRTPLASIRGDVEMLLDQDEIGPLTDRQVECLQIVQHSADRLLKVTNDFLDLTRIEAGWIELVLQPTDLTALVEAVAAEQAPQLEARAQRLTLRAPPGLPAALVDSVRTGQILINLLSNASKYAPQGGSITISLRKSEEEGFLEIAVEDNGVGIAVEDQAKLFTRFFRAGSAYLTGAEGVGLGLAIARSLVELHGGRIWFESESDKGSTFFVTLPIADTEPRVVPSPRDLTHRVSDDAELPGFLFRGFR